jgi:hypothetical protein
MPVVYSINCMFQRNSSLNFKGWWDWQHVIHFSYSTLASSEELCAFRGLGDDYCSNESTELIVCLLFQALKTSNICKTNGIQYASMFYCWLLTCIFLTTRSIRIDWYCRGDFAKSENFWNNRWNTTWKQLLKRNQKDPGLLNVLFLALSGSEKRVKSTQLAEIRPEAFVEITGVKKSESE